MYVWLKWKKDADKYMFLLSVGKSIESCELLFKKWYTCFTIFYKHDWEQAMCQKIKFVSF